MILLKVFQDGAFVAYVLESIISIWLVILFLKWWIKAIKNEYSTYKKQYTMVEACKKGIIRQRTNKEKLVAAFRSVSSMYAYVSGLFIGVVCISVVNALVRFYMFYDVSLYREFRFAWWWHARHGPVIIAMVAILIDLLSREKYDDRRKPKRKI